MKIIDTNYSINLVKSYKLFSGFLLFGRLAPFFLFLFSIQVASGQNSWQQTGGPEGGNISSFATIGSNLFAGVHGWTGGMFLSTNNGVSWSSAVNNGLYSGDVNCLAVSGMNLIAGGCGMYISTNNGASWTSPNYGFNGYINSIAVSGTNLYVATSSGLVYLSTNSGGSWTQFGTGLPSVSITSLAIIDTNIYAGTYGGGVYLITKNGTTWGTVNNGLTNMLIQSLAVSGTNLFAGTNNAGVFLSTNKGASWTSVNTGLTSNNGYVSSIFVNGTNLYALCGWSGIYLSTNNGTSWTQVGNGLANTCNVNALTVSGTNLVAGTGSGVFILSNNGNTWAQANNGLIGTQVTAMVVSGTNLFAGTHGNPGGVFLSTNNGASWVNTGVSSDVSSLVTNGAILYAGGWGVYFSTSNGNFWTQTSGINGYVQAVLIKGSNLFAGTNGGVFLSTDDGTSWTAVDDGLTNTNVTALYTSGPNLYAGTTGGGVFLSADNGKNWTEIDNGFTNANVSAILISGSNLFAGTNGGGVFLSTNNGSSWTAVNNWGLNTNVNSLLMNGTNLFAGTSGGVFVSSNNGTTWTPVGSFPNTSNQLIMSLVVNGTYLYAGTNISGVWKYPLSSILQSPTVITSFSPTTGTIGTTVTITGSNFSPTTTNNVVYFGAVKAVVNNATSTSLTVTVPAGATYQPISVTNLTTGLTALSQKPFIVTFPGSTTIDAGSFATKIDIAMRSGPNGFTLADVDGDGKPDLVVANSYNNSVSVYRNTSTNGNISFASRIDFAVGNNPNRVVIGDIDGDGIPDIAVANQGSNTISVLRNLSTSGNISFASKVDINVWGGTIGLAIGDIDGDGKLDLAVTGTGNNAVLVCRNVSTAGNISFSPILSFTTGFNPQEVIIGDVDGDGLSDLVVTNQSSNTVSVLRNTGNITFAPKVDLTTGIGPNCVAMGDMDGDGLPDIAVTNSNGNTISIFWNKSTSGNISFSSKTDFTTDNNPYGIKISDMDGDGKLDLVVADQSSSSVSVYKNIGSSGNISFAAKVDFGTGNNPMGIVLSDVDGDGKPDILVTNQNSNTVSVLRNILFPIPQNLTSSASSGQVMLKWNKVVANRFFKYCIYIGKDSTAVAIKDSTSVGNNNDTIRTIAGLTNGTVYYFRVTAMDSSRLEGGKSSAAVATPTVLNALREYNPDANTVLLMHMDETSGSSLSDASNFGNNGTTTGTTIVSGRFGQSRNFSDPNDNITVLNSVSLNFGSGPFTAELWLKTNADSGSVFGKYSGSVHYSMGFASGSRIAPVISDGLNSASPWSFRSVGDGKWHHVAEVRDASTFKVYIDGVLDNQTSSLLVGSTDNTGSFWIGQNSSLGMVDEVRLSKIARSPQEFNLQLPPINLKATPSGTTV
ncbi:MAG: FG-GAP-like repeat-containing protein, partial [Bacteroidota bacterium]